MTLKILLTLRDRIVFSVDNLDVHAPGRPRPLRPPAAACSILIIVVVWWSSETRNFSFFIEGHGRENHTSTPVAAHGD